MITIEPHQALFPTRFAYSPLWETVSAVRCVLYPQRHALHARWAMRQQVHLNRFDVIAGLLPMTGWAPAFLTPPPEPDAGPPDIGRELSRLAGTDIDVVTQELDRLESSHGDIQARERVRRDPRGLLSHLTELLDWCFTSMLGGIWPRARDHLEGDLDWRGSRLVEGGLPAVLSDLSPEITFDARAIRLRSAACITRTLDERGLLLMPTVFAWPTVTAYVESDWQPTLVYSARAPGEIWLDSGRGTHALTTLLGRRRGMILELIDRPRSTTELGRAIAISPATVSEHLQALHAAGLASRRRSGREQLYKQTGLGRELVRSCRAHP